MIYMIFEINKLSFDFSKELLNFSTKKSDL
jgi:hypothetical protein